MRSTGPVILGLMGTMLAGTTLAEIKGIPKQDGFSGFVQLGVASTSINSNFLVGGDDDETARIDSLDDQAGSDLIGPDFNFDVRYTFAAARTQVYLGNLLQDAVTLDFTQQLGVRREMGSNGIASVALVFSGIPGEVWQDPYLTNADRQSTDRTSTGFRLGWDGIMGSDFDASLTSRSIEIDDEESGDSVPVLTGAEQQSLVRDGDNFSLQAGYNWKVAAGNIVKPSLLFTSMDADGDAVSYEKTGAQVTWSYRQEKFSVISNVLLAQVQYDEINPVLDEKVDADEMALSVLFMWHRLGGVKGLNATAMAAYGESDANADFYDTDLSRISAGLMYTY